MKIIPALTSLLFISTLTPVEMPIEQVLQQIDPATRIPKDTTTEFSVSGIVVARVVASDGTSAAFVLNSGNAALTVVGATQEMTNFVPQNEIKLSGKLTNGFLGAILALTDKSSSVLNENLGFQIDVVGPAAFKDPSPLAGHYVQITNMLVSPNHFAAGGRAVAMGGDGTEIPLLIGKAAEKHAPPSEPVNIYGIPVKTAEGWKLAVSRFRLVRAPAARELAQNATCFTCHSVVEKLIGPPYREVAAKYRNDPDAIAKISAQIEKGGGGKWGGMIPMPAMGSKVTAEERELLAKWILSYSWDFILAE